MGYCAATRAHPHLSRELLPFLGHFHLDFGVALDIAGFHGGAHPRFLPLVLQLCNKLVVLLDLLFLPTPRPHPVNRGRRGRTPGCLAPLSPRTARPAHLGGIHLFNLSPEVFDPLPALEEVKRGACGTRGGRPPCLPPLGVSATCFSRKMVSAMLRSFLLSSAIVARRLCNRGASRISPVWSGRFVRHMLALT